MLRYFHYGSDEEIEDRESAFTCSECGENKEIEYNSDGKGKYTEYACLCNKCGHMWDVYRIDE